MNLSTPNPEPFAVSKASQSSERSPSLSSAFGFAMSSTNVLLATKHAKETVIAPLFVQELGMTVRVPDHFDSDRFGTFTRDLERRGNQLEAARAKANAVLDRDGGTVAIASEGAFFPDPMLPLVPCNREIVVLIDRELNLEIVGQSISSRTNFSHKTVTSVEEAIEFAATAQFPEHGLVVMPDANASDHTSDPGAIIKGIETTPALIDAVESTLSASSNRSAHVETDMRAMHNPMRMAVIAEATCNLIANIQRCCPKCGTPGFSMAERKPGLPCGLCQCPTNLILKEIYACSVCGHTADHFYPDGVKMADPGQCWNCNP